MCFSVEYKSGMKMKIPTGGSGNGYYGHESGVISYLDMVEVEADVQSTADGDFSEYMWMENEEEFDKQVNRFINVNLIKEKRKKMFIPSSSPHLFQIFSSFLYFLFNQSSFFLLSIFFSILNRHSIAEKELANWIAAHYRIYICSQGQNLGFLTFKRGTSLFASVNGS